MTTSNKQFTIQQAIPGTHGFYAMKKDGDQNRISIQNRSASGNCSSHVGYIHPNTGNAIISNDRLQKLLTEGMIQHIINHFNKLK